MKTTPSTGIYEEIKSKLANCKTQTDYVEAYRWLADEFIRANESAKNFENKVIEKYGKDEFGILLYGSVSAWERQKNFEERMSTATKSEREALFIEKILAQSEEESVEYPELWKEDGEISILEDFYQKLEKASTYNRMAEREIAKAKGDVVKMAKNTVLEKEKQEDREMA